MTDDDIKTLQATASAIAPGIAVITVETRQDVVYEPDPRKGFEGRNRLATRTPCADCKATGSVTDAEGFPEICATCSGLGFSETETRWPVDHVSITLGHHTIEGFDCVDGKGRVDKRQVRTIDQLVPMLRAALSNIAMNVLRPHHPHHIDAARAQLLASVAIAAGVVPSADVNACLAVRLAMLAGTPLGKAAVTMLAVKCTACGARTSSQNQTELRARFQPDPTKPAECPHCDSTALVYSLVTRDDAGVETSQPVS